MVSFTFCCLRFYYWHFNRTVIVSNVSQFFHKYCRHHGRFKINWMEIALSALVRYILGLSQWGPRFTSFCAKNKIYTNGLHTSVILTRITTCWIHTWFLHFMSPIGRSHFSRWSCERWCIMSMHCSPRDVMRMKVISHWCSISTMSVLI